VIGIPKSTLSDWKRRNPKVEAALCISQDGVLSDVKSRLTNIALHGSDKDSISAGSYLLTKYGAEAEPTTVITTTDDDIKDEILTKQSL